MLGSSRTLTLAVSLAAILLVAPPAAAGTYQVREVDTGTAVEIPGEDYPVEGGLVGATTLDLDGGVVTITCETFDITGAVVTEAGDATTDPAGEITDVVWDDCTESLSSGTCALTANNDWQVAITSTATGTPLPRLVIEDPTVTATCVFVLGTATCTYDADELTGHIAGSPQTLVFDDSDPTTFNNELTLVTGGGLCPAQVAVNASMELAALSRTYQLQTAANSNAWTGTITLNRPSGTPFKFTSDGTDTFVCQTATLTVSILTSGGAGTSPFGDVDGTSFGVCAHFKEGGCSSVTLSAQKTFRVRFEASVGNVGGAVVTPTLAISCPKDNTCTYSSQVFSGVLTNGSPMTLAILSVMSLTGGSGAPCPKTITPLGTLQIQGGAAPPAGTDLKIVHVGTNPVEMEVVSI